MLHLPGLKLVLRSYSTQCERYLVGLGVACAPAYLDDVDGAQDAPEWLVDALHYAAACPDAEREAVDVGKRY